MDWLRNKKTIISTVLLGIAMMLEQLGFVEVSSHVNELGETIKEGAWLQAVQVLLGTLVAIFMRMGILKAQLGERA